jgi:hypothetical protein
MLILRQATSNGIDDIKIIGETDLEIQFIHQLASAGTLSCINNIIGSSVIFRPISIASATNASYNEDFPYTNGSQEFSVPDGIVVKNVFRGGLRLSKNKYTFDGKIVKITYDTLETDEIISITN